MITDVNLPACQLQVFIDYCFQLKLSSFFYYSQIAMGICLHRIKDIRLLYDEEPFGISPIDFDIHRAKLQPLGHAIAARITSENPDEVNNKTFVC
jgi:biotin carboxylase